MNKLEVLLRYVYCYHPIRKPLVNNKIVFTSYLGKQYSCNPMYICEYLLKNYPGKFQIVWAFNFPEKFKFLEKRGINIVETQSREHIDHMLTAKVIITNESAYEYMPKIKGQTVINTWHGGGAYKKIGFSYQKQMKNIWFTLYYKRLCSRDTVFVSSCKAASEKIIREGRMFKGELLETGMPRNDIFFIDNDNGIKKRVKDFFGLDEKTNIVLYAPTYRSISDYDPGKELDFKKINEVMRYRFGGEKWVTLYRQHSRTKDDLGVLQATKYPDMQELLYTADVLITDYSSCAWDFSLTFRPVFLFCPDYDEYVNIRDFYTPVEDWPYVLCKNGKESLYEAIMNYDDVRYKKAVIEHHRLLGSYENGHATERVCERIIKECFC